MTGVAASAGVTEFTVAAPVAPAATLLAPVALAVALDLAAAEPPRRVHPVALFGTLVGRFDREWARPRLVGVAVAVMLPLAAAAVCAGIVWLAGFRSWPSPRRRPPASRSRASACCST